MFEILSFFTKNVCQTSASTSATMKGTSALFSLECEECNTKEEESCLWTEGFAWLDSRNCFLWRKTGLELSYLQPFVNPSTCQLSFLFPTECLPQMLVLSPSLRVSGHRGATLRLHSQSRSSPPTGPAPREASSASSL